MFKLFSIFRKTTPQFNSEYLLGMEAMTTVVYTVQNNTDRKSRYRTKFQKPDITKP